MEMSRTGLVTDSKARTISGWFGSGLVLHRDGIFLIRENTAHKISKLFGWYLCKFRGFVFSDQSAYGYKFDGYSKSK
jgi:hypothetical protein